MATTFCVPIDNAATTVATAYVAGSSTVVVSDGSLFGSPSAGAPVRFSMIASSGLDAYGRVSDRTKVATYRCTGRSSNTLTGVTLESGTDQNFGIGSFVGVLVTAQTLSTIHTAVNTLETGKADLASPALTGTPTAPTASAGTNTTQVATTAFVSTAVGALPASAITSGQVATARGGTGVDGSAAANGRLLIGNGSGYSLASLTAGSNVTITNGAGAITIAASGGSPGGASGNLQYQSSGSFAGLAGSTVGGSGVMVSLVSQAATDVGYQFVNHASQSADPYRVLASNGSTVNARVTKDGYVGAGTSTIIGAITAKGGTAFSGVPAYGTATIGSIEQTGGSWAGSGFVFANADTGSKAFSMVCNADIAFFGWLAASGAASIGMVFNPNGLGIGINYAYVGTNRLDVNGGLALGAYAGLYSTSNGILCPGTVGIGTSSPTGKLHLVSTNAAQQLLIVDAHASQTANLTEWRSSGGTVYGSVSENGYFTTRKTSAPADGELAASEVALWFDSTNGAAKLMIKGKSADGTVVTGSVALT